MKMEVKGVDENVELKSSPRRIEEKDHNVIEGFLSVMKVTERGS